MALIFTKVFHELGHAVAAKQLGCRIPTMGVAFLVMFPVLYTDTTDAWRLSSYRQRMIIGSAGMLTELSIACLATFLWTFLPEGGLKSAVFVLATVTWVTTLLVNLNPLMRFDGYYLLSDFWQVENLQQRAFSLARWQLREWLFGFNHPAPEAWTKRDGRKLLFYAYATWLYRFFLFLGIALLVYHFFFKVLGLFLFLVELVWFIGLPVYREIRHWWGERENMIWNRKACLSFISLGTLTLIFFLPLNQNLSLPAVMTAGKSSLVYPPLSGGKIEALQVSEGEGVSKGQVLVKLINPDLEQQRKVLQMKRHLIRTLLNRSVTDYEYQQNAPVLRRRLAALQESLEGINRQQDQLVVRAPFNGRVTYLDSSIKQGIWVNRGAALLRLVDEGSAQVEAYVKATDLVRVQQGREGRFYGDDLTVDDTSLTVIGISPVSSAMLEKEYFSSDYGGQVPVSRDAQGKAIPDDALYKVLLKLKTADGVHTQRVLTGSVSLNVPGRSMADYTWESIWSVLIRESGV
jgi:putative peptide zinc metalloprotease protein